MSRFRVSGFTLVELMIALAVLAILIAIAAPDFSAWIARQRITAQANELVGDISLARSESANRGVHTRICISSDGATCTGNSWTAGWLVFADVNGDGAYTAGTDTLVTVHGAFSGNTTVTTTGFSTAGYLEFMPYGGLHSTAGSLKFCSTTISPNGTQVDVAVTGRPQASRISSC